MIMGVGLSALLGASAIVVGGRVVALESGDGDAGGSVSFRGRVPDHVPAFPRTLDEVPADFVFTTPCRAT
jgi:hypothetical protein